MKTWKTYLIRCEKTERIYVGVTGLEDPLRRVEQHREKATNEELHMDLRAFGTGAFQFFVLAVFDDEARAYECERSTITCMRHIVGDLGLYNRREGGFGKSPIFRKSLLTWTKAEMHQRTHNFRQAMKSKKRNPKHWKASQQKAQSNVPAERARRHWVKMHSGAA